MQSIQQHTNGLCPVPSDTLVTYKTSNRAGDKTNWHIPMPAKDLNWAIDGYNRIVEYRLAKSFPKLNIKPLFNHHEMAEILRMRELRK